ncbi:bifunctional YncE family protein/alkaline phosphatase family protein [Paenarthrobacter sp. Z7-10]|uniref:bifunctional YncE family protein/alkaline phosphatase family protein n=1 Tax=Paenarthrobacter sp. Z7-10 TaxID=2787635 RepID=UPI0022A92E3C|nr:bifunctional YncE family protein/alkaline phosphatase family protein [Paenarthrobacter sp. Z7-10]MCZ2403980.1 bifunctional YncE family protein/alkaline phosphatase family protein [Paenarthrobacter sp. Z7-10]
MRGPAIVVTAALALTAAAGVAGVASTMGADSQSGKQIGQQPNGSFLTQTGQSVSPVGDVIKTNGRPFGLALSKDGRTAAALNNGGATAGMVTVYDLVNHTVLQQAGTGGKSNSGIVYSPDGKTLWAARPNDLQRFPVLADGRLGAPVTVPLPGAKGLSPVPAGLAFARNGQLLVTLSANNTLGVIDPGTNTLVKQIPVGNVPNGVTVVGGKAYVSNQGGRPALASDRTDNSYGTPIVTNNDSAVPSTGTVSEVDLARGAQSRVYPVGRGPSAVLAVGRTVLVANSDDDTVTSIDTAKGRVGRTFVTNPIPGGAFGATPNGLTMLDRDHLAVSLGRDNAVAVYSYQNATSEPSFEGLIPAGSYPSGIVKDKQLNRLVIASEQGIGSRGPDGTVNEGVNTTPAASRLGYNFVGTVQTVPVPDAKQMRTYTDKVFQNNNWNGLLKRNQAGSKKATPVALPTRTGDPSKIKHVFMIVKENRTYDQVLGDDPRGNGDASLAQFGQRVTPNTHALAKQFPLIDNLYSDGTNSAEGHHWLDQAYVNNYMQQMYGGYTRSYQTGDPMSNVKSGWIWENAARHGKTANNWGEQVDSYTDAKGKGTPADWDGWLHDSRVLDGSAPGPLKYPLGTYTAKTDIPSLAKITKPNFPNFDLNIPDQYRAAMFGNDFKAYVKHNNLPAFNMAWIMSDHTNGTSAQSPTRTGISPEAYVADNDLAVGRIVDQISHSKYWKDSAIFVVEDDSQNGVDHVDGHRAPVQVISPYAKRGAVVHSYYSQLNVMRTIEQILGLPPMNSQDMTAKPMYDVFTDKANFTPFTHLPNQVPLTERNPGSTTQGTTPAAPGTPTAPAAPAGNPKAVTAEAAWAKWSTQQDWSREDSVNMAQGNRDVWYSSNGFTRPYPGDSAVLLPEQVPGSGKEPKEGAGD